MTVNEINLGTNREWAYCTKLHYSFSLTHTCIHNHTYTHTFVSKKFKLEDHYYASSWDRTLVKKPLQRNKSGSVVGPAVQWGIAILVSRFMSIGHLRSPGQQCMVHLGETSQNQLFQQVPPLKQTSNHDSSKGGSKTIHRLGWMGVSAKELTLTQDTAVNYFYAWPNHSLTITMHLLL